MANDTLIWRAAGGDGTRRGLFAESVEIRIAPGKQLSVQGSVQASVVFDADGRAFVADMAGAVQAFSTGGELLWRVRLPGSISGTPAVHSTKPLLFVGTHTGLTCGLATDSGRSVWRKELPTKADPRILSDLLYLPKSNVVVLSSWGGRFYALEADSGNERFSWEAGISPASAAAAGGDGLIYCLRAKSDRGVEFVRIGSAGEETVLHCAREEKRGARRTLVSAGPVLDEARAAAYLILNRDRSSELLAWSLQNNSVTWTRPLPKTVQATPAIRRDGTLLIADLGGGVHALGPDGTHRFQYQSSCEYLLSGAVVEGGGTTFLGDPVGALHRVDPRGAGQPIFETERAIQARPAFDPGGRLYLPSTGRKVYVFERQQAAGSKAG